MPQVIVKTGEVFMYLITSTATAMAGSFLGLFLAGATLYLLVKLIRRFLDLRL